MSGDEQNVSSTTDPISVLAISHLGATDLGDMKGDMGDDEDSPTVGTTSLLANPGFLGVVSPSLTNPTLQGLLSSPTVLQGAQLGLPQGVQIVTVSSPSDILPNQSVDIEGRVWHVISPEQAIITVGDVGEIKQGSLMVGQGVEETDSVTSTDLSGNIPNIASVLMPPPNTNLPPCCPAWAARMKNCEKIGNYYRGYVDTEAELDILLTYHKQATQSFWGTRQSPSPAKMSSRLMWKSQYVPYDGIPFVNTGSRAIVQECQFGPRRKGTLAKKQTENNSGGDYRQTCPARIYIKKVRKFPEFKIDPSLERKNAKTAMDKAFHSLKQANVENCGQDRFYVQLPLNSAHEFHDIPSQMSVAESTTTQTITSPVEPEQVKMDGEKSDRLNPQVAQKIREIVAGGETRVYQVRRLLRSYVCREVYNGSTDSVQRHDLSLFPTVTDLKNHIHQAVKDIQTGSLPLTAPTVNVEAMANHGEDPMHDLSVWPQNLVSSGPVPETVTVTLTQGPGEDGGHVISRIETHLSDGTTQISTSLTPETAQLLARLNPAMFPPGSLVQLQAASQQSDLNEEEKFDPNYGISEMEVQESSQFTDNLTIQTTDVNSLPIPVLEPGTTCNLLSKGGSASIAEQNTDLVLMPVQSSLEDLQEENCEQDRAPDRGGDFNFKM